MKKLFQAILPLFALLILITTSSFSIQAADKKTPKNEMVTEDGNTVYYDSNGEIVLHKLITIKGKTYYFDRNGYLKKNCLFTYRSNTYYANKSGVIAKNKFVDFENDTRFFFDKDGKQVTGFVNYNGHTYYCPASGSVFKKCWKKIGSYYYYFRSGGYIAKNTWIDDYYVDASGRRIGEKKFHEEASKRKVISMSNIKQNPELPTGCESVALTMVLKYYHYPVSKTTIATSYLPRSSSNNFVTAFLGNPFSYSGFGIYSPGLTNTANKYLKAKKATRQAHDLTGIAFTDLYRYIDAGVPVIVWNSMYMRTPHAVLSYKYNNKTWNFYSGEHCVVLCGYDKSKKKVLINDSLSGLVWRNAAAFEKIYNKMGKMAVVITKE